MADDMEPVRIGILGMGTVGQGTVRVLKRNAEEISRRVGRELRVVHAAVRNPTRLEGLGLDARISSDPWAVVRDPEVDVIVEVMGGQEPALSLLMAAVAAGKHVVTANKALLAEHGNEIFAAAQARGVMVAFEAAVAGAIPIIKAIREGLAGQGRGRRVLHPLQELQHARLAGGLCGGKPQTGGRPGADEELSGLWHLYPDSGGSHHRAGKAAGLCRRHPPDVRAAPRRALRGAGRRGLGSRQAQGDHVRLGADS